jgi:hypothetical protein
MNTTTTNTTTALPTDRGLLRGYLPPEPTDTAVARARAGGRRLNELIADAAAALDEHDRKSRAAISRLADCAIDGGDIAAANLALAAVTGQRAVLVEALDQLRAARASVTQREWTAQSNDPAYTAWVAAGQQVTREWEQAMSAESEELRFANLVAFAERHRR